MAMSWTLMFSWAMLSRRSGSLIFRKSGRSCTSQFMSRRCNKQVCTHDRAGSRALESRDNGQIITPMHRHTLNYANHCCKHKHFTESSDVWMWCVRTASKNLLLIEVAEALYCFHQHEHQLMVGTPHLLSKLLPTVRQLREITEKDKENSDFFFFLFLHKVYTNFIFIVKCSWESYGLNCLDHKTLDLGHCVKHKSNKMWSFSNPFWHIVNWKQYKDNTFYSMFYLTNFIDFCKEMLTLNLIPATTWDRSNRRRGKKWNAPKVIVS